MPSPRKVPPDRELLALIQVAALPPTIRELAEAIGVSHMTVHAHLCRLRAAGLVTWVPGHPRTLQVVVSPPLQDGGRGSEAALEV